MSEHPRERGRQEREHIDIEQEYDRRRWAERFGVSEHVLQEAVDQVGPLADDVEQALQGRARAGQQRAHENDSALRGVTDELGLTTPKNADRDE